MAMSRGVSIDEAAARPRERALDLLRLSRRDLLRPPRRDLLPRGDLLLPRRDLLRPPRRDLLRPRPFGWYCRAALLQAVPFALDGA